MAQSVAFAVDVHVVVGTLARITDGFYQEVMWAAFVAAQMCRFRSFTSRLPLWQGDPTATAESRSQLRRAPLS